MMESYAYELIKKEGYEEGVRSGIEQGLQQGRQQGMEQGLEQGLQQGTLEATREHIVEILQERFQDVPKEILRSLRKIHDPDALKLLFRKALRVDSLDAFHKAVSGFLD
ncbi:Essential protein Yae1, N terminal [Desulfacinum hydrothermale DSM 13146]|uniref:Essential protein Yae1, N terminal n=1 Tax=Desulfacinum hydrothermale DSM 13146 TaxID=1121390 RepID=A0A1W1XCQ8_9BACT|nr:Yae1 family protein [Desulfacinum hydrothermale]SMC21679.1 Essential protein Yae1, N terminal [Desulfacinum hydrothermale DSM 13146]